MSENSDPYDLARFLDAQAPVIVRALAEIRSGSKRSHWMWFVFPQLAGLGSSAMSRRYAIGSRHEAEAYLHHPVLGPRLVECCDAVLSVETHTAHEIFGSPDDLKLRSCVTLFAAIASAPPVFELVIERCFAGEPDRWTLELLAERS